MWRCAIANIQHPTSNIQHPTSNIEHRTSIHPHRYITTSRHRHMLSSHYSRFRVGERILLTGHSHQAWPDVAFDAQQRAWLDAAELVDDKWTRAFEIADNVREGWRRLLNEPGADIALGQNTHELIVRLLSAFLTRPTSPTRLITTDGEFHTI